MEDLVSEAKSLLVILERASKIKTNDEQTFIKNIPKKEELVRKAIVVSQEYQSMMKQNHVLKEEIKEIMMQKDALKVEKKKLQKTLSKLKRIIFIKRWMTTCPKP